jgi:lambda family phage portal protein
MGAWGFEWDTLPRFDAEGRPVTIHGFTADRAEQVRGLSAFASILIAFRDVQRFTEAELGAAIINALFAAFVKSNFDPIAVAEALGLDGDDLGSQAKGWQSVRGEIAGDGYRFGDNLIPILPPGDEVQVPGSGRTSGGFDVFEQAVHRGIANGLGMDAPSFTGDLSKVNYSSLQYGLSGVWDLVTAEGFEFDSDTLSPIEYAVIQEAFERGYIQEPIGAEASFEQLPQAYLNGRHIGPGRPQIDRVKNAQASALEIYLGLNSATNIAEENGRDYEEILADQSEERNLAEQYGFTRATLAEVGGVKSEEPRTETEA